MKRDVLKKVLFLSLLLFFSLSMGLSLDRPATAAGPVAALTPKAFLPLVLDKPTTPTPTPETRLVVFEGFYRPT